MSMAQMKLGSRNKINDQNRRLENLWPNGSIADNFFECNGNWEQLGNDINGFQENSYSGSAVAISGDGLVTAVRSLLGGGESAQKVAPVNVFKYNKMKSTWQKLGEEIVGRWKSGLSRESVSLSDDGMTVAVGGITVDTVKNVRVGYTKIFTYNSVAKSWKQLGNEIEGFGAKDKRGRTVTLSKNGRTILIGETGFKSGEVMIFKYNEKTSTWKRKGKIIDFTAAEGDYTDVSISISDDASTVAIGNENKSTTGSRSGSVKVYQYDSSEGIWSRLGNVINGHNPNQRFGSSVSLSGDATFIAVGSDGTRKDTGSTRIYNLQSREWKMIGNPIRGLSVEEFSGCSVSMSPDGSVVAIGAPGVGTERGEFVGATRIYAYKKNRGTYVQVGDDIFGYRRGDYSGASLELSKDGRTLVIGAPFHNVNGQSEVGLTRVYRWNSPCAPTVAPTEVPTRSPTYSPTFVPTKDPSQGPSAAPTTSSPTVTPSMEPSVGPTVTPSMGPSAGPTVTPSMEPSTGPTISPSNLPSEASSEMPTVYLSSHPTQTPNMAPSNTPSVVPIPSQDPSSITSQLPSSTTTIYMLSKEPSANPTMGISQNLTQELSHETLSSSPSISSSTYSTTTVTSKTISPSSTPATTPFV